MQGLETPLTHGRGFPGSPGNPFCAARSRPKTRASHHAIVKGLLSQLAMQDFEKPISQQQITQGYSLLNLMDSLDREMDLINQQRLHVGISTAEGKRLTEIKQSHLSKIQDCVKELEKSGFNAWLMQQAII